MYIQDLTRLPPGHPPSPYYFPMPVKLGDKWGYGFLPEGLILCAIGWLGDTVPTSGDSETECIDRLFRAFKSGSILFDGTAGWHNCELCQGDDQWYPGGQVGPVVRWGWRRVRVRGYGHFLIQHGNIVYMAPALILHYIVDHSYKPPGVFVEAVLTGKILTTSDLIWAEEASG